MTLALKKKKAEEQQQKECETKKARTPAYATAPESAVSAVQPVPPAEPGSQPKGPNEPADKVSTGAGTREAVHEGAEGK